MNTTAKFTDGKFELEVTVGNEENIVWLNGNEISSLFHRDFKTINRHINDIYKSNELDRASTVSKFEIVQQEGSRTITRNINYYNLDMILAVGYRVKSDRGVKFRKWSSEILKNYLLQGVAYNEKVLEAQKKVINLIPLLDRDTDKMDSKQVLSVVKEYAKALNLLDDYDHQRIEKLHGEESNYVLQYVELRAFIDEMKFKNDSTLFGVEKDESFKSSISSIYATFDGKDLYISIQEKAASLLYFITKNHSFIDGNKRIAAAVFLYFLSKNNYLYVNNQKVISDETLVAITIMIASSKPSEKDILIDLVVHLLST
jgi:prophage maintenance system killer protein